MRVRNVPCNEYHGTTDVEACKGCEQCGGKGYLACDDFTPATIRKGDTVRIRPEWQDEGDEHITFIALEDEEGGRVRIQAQLGLAINPNQVVGVEMVERVEFQASVLDRNNN